MAPSYPDIKEQWLKELKQMLKRYDLIPFCWNAFLDLGAKQDSQSDEDEMISCVLRNLIHAKKSGFSLIKIQSLLPVETLHKLLPLCKDLDMKLGIEYATQEDNTNHIWKEYFALMRGEGKGYLGLIPKLPAISKDQLDITFHIQGCFFESNIPYEKLLLLLTQVNYKGSIAAVYEGHQFTDYFLAQEELKQYKKVLDSILAT